jgi:hypothetical protein
MEQLQEILDLLETAAQKAKDSQFIATAQMIWVVKGAIQSGPDAVAELRDIMLEFAKADRERIIARNGLN